MFARFPRICAAILLVAGLGVSAPLIGSAMGDSANGQVGSTYVPMTPTRILDSRYGIGLSGPFSVHVARTFAVSGSAGVPADATAVTGNLTVTSQSAPGYLYISPVATDYPASSTLNFPAGDDRANAVTVALAPDGSLSVTYVAPTFGPTAQVIFDLSGYFVPNDQGATYVPLAPARLLDTRYGIGLSGVFDSAVPRTFAVAGRGGVPGNASAVTGNLTVTQQTGLGYLFIGPTPMSQPATSTLNFPVGDDRANGVAVPLGPGGTLSVTYITPAPGPSAQVVFDVSGYFLPDGTGALYYPIAPDRVADSRLNLGINGPVSSREPVTLSLVRDDTPIPSGAQAVTGNVTVTQQSSAGWVSVTPFASVPATSTLNFPVGDDRANEFIGALSAVETMGLTYAGAFAGGAQIVVDISGYFAGGSTATPVAPAFSGMSLYRASAWSHQATQSWCTGASVQMMLNLVTGAVDHSPANQGAYYAYAVANSIYKWSAGVSVDGWAHAASHYGAGFYHWDIHSTFAEMIKVAATRMRITGKPVGLVVDEGAHAWVMAGFTSSGDDPALGQNFTVTTITIMAPDYGTIAYDPAPGSVESIAYMRTKMDGKINDSADSYVTVIP